VLTLPAHTILDVLLHRARPWTFLRQTQAPILAWKASDPAAVPSPRALRFLRELTAPMVVPLDGSMLAERALPLAMALAHGFGNPSCCCGRPSRPCLQVVSWTMD
jgi:hypothetical protein